MQADTKIAFVPVPNKDYQSIIVEMRTSERVVALLEQLDEFTTWHHK